MSKDAEKVLNEIIDEPFTFGFLIKSIRETEYDDMTQHKFAEFLGISKSRLSDIENNRYTISIKKAIELAIKLEQSKRFFVATTLQDMLNKNNLNYKIGLEMA
jgi:transcriptional regulator with XRE-family HTH domain